MDAILCLLQLGDLPTHAERVTVATSFVGFRLLRWLCVVISTKARSRIGGLEDWGMFTGASCATCAEILVFLRDVRIR